MAQHCDDLVERLQSVELAIQHSFDLFFGRALKGCATICQQASDKLAMRQGAFFSCQDQVAQANDLGDLQHGCNTQQHLAGQLKFTMMQGLQNVICKDQCFCSNSKLATSKPKSRVLRST